MCIRDSGKGDGPLHGLHSAEAAADDRRPAPDAEVIGQPSLACLLYTSMGDQVGARGLLEEVLSEGGASQKQRATDLLKKIG